MQRHAGLSWLDLAIGDAGGGTKQGTVSEIPSARPERCRRFRFHAPSLHPCSA